MIPYLTIMQQIFASSADIGDLNTTDINAPINGTSTLPAIPADPSSLFALLFSFSALRDWFKLIVIGGFFETSRRLIRLLYNKIIGSFFISASFDQGDASYNWILVWLSKQPSWSKMRDVHISTSYGSNSPTFELDGEDEHVNEIFKSSRKISYLPSISSTYSLWYQRHWVSITRTQQQTGIYGDKENTLYITILTRDHKVLKTLLQEARGLYIAGQEHNICVYVSDNANHWNHVACRAKRSMGSIVLDPGIKDMLIEDARDFLRSKRWYAGRGIPFRRGYLLYGAPGSGKTSMIHCMAGELGLDVYIISLSRAGLDDSSLSALINALPEHCIALMEDIDAAFTHGVSRDRASEDVLTSPTPGALPPPGVSANKLSLSGLLNALDGVGVQEGRILFATTNKYSALDAALCRPGRMDLHIEFKDASKYQARELFSRFYHPTEMSLVDDNNEEGSGNSGYGSDDDLSESNVIDEREEEKQANSRAIARSSPLALVIEGPHIRRAPKLCRNYIAKLADRFADAIPERECSMASLQGYLMTYKTRPIEAVNNAAAWVEKGRVLKEENEKHTTSTLASSLATVGVVSSPGCTCGMISEVIPGP